MKRAAGILVILTIALTSAVQLAAQEKDKLPNYYPFKVGTKWHYELDPGTGQKVQLYTLIAKIDMTDGKPLARLEMWPVGEAKPKATEDLTSSAQGIFRSRINEKDLSPPVCILKYPWKKGETWNSETKIDNEQWQIKAKSGDSEEDVTVPAGKFKTVTTEVQTTVSGMKVATKYWFAENVGVVKQTMELDGKNYTLDLVKFEEAK